MTDVVEPHPVRELVVDRRRHLSLRADSVLEVMSTPRGLRQLVAGVVVVGAVAVVLGGWPWVSSAVAWVGLLLLRWWGKAGRALRSGLGVGQRVSVRSGSAEDLQVTDETGSVQLARGAAHAVIRWRGNVSVYAASVCFVLPGELLSDEDVVFLLDAPTATAASTEPGEPGFGQPVSVDAHTYRHLLTTTTRLVVTSADFLFPAVIATAVIAVVALAGSSSATAVTAVVCLGWTASGLEGVFASRRAVGTAYLPGRQLRLATRADGFVLSAGGVTRTHPWTDYRAHRVTSHVVLLRRERRPFTRTTTEVYPAELFDRAAEERLTAAVPRQF